MKHRIPSLLFVVICGLAPAVFADLLHWSAWLWGFISMVTTSGSVLVVMTVHSGGTPADSYEPWEPAPPVAPTEQPYQETRVIDASLPSAADGYDFLFSATVWWRPILGHANRSDDACPALAVSSVVSRALEVVHREEPGRAGSSRYLLEGQLGVPLPDQSGRVKALASDVKLTLGPADRERLQKLNDLRKDEEIWEYERQHECNKRRYLGDDVLKSAGSAVVWWLARHENEIEKAVGMIGPLAQIAAAANDEEVPELFRHLIVPPGGAPHEATAGTPLGDGHLRGEEPFDREEELGVSDRLLLLLSALGLKPDMDEYTVFVHRVVRSLEVAGLNEAAEEIRRTLLPAPDESSGEEPEGGPSEEDTTETWSSGFPAPGGSPFAGRAAGPHADASTYAPGPTEDGAGERNHDWWQTNGNAMTSPFLQNGSHQPAPPRAGDEEDEGGS